MRLPRNLNLLVAAAGLVFLTGCSTETLTDSAFWSYLPFTSSKGGHGGGGSSTQGSPTTPTAKTPAAQPKRPESHGDEGWNEPAPGQTETKPAQTQPRLGAATGKPANTAAGGAKTQDASTRPSPTLPTNGEAGVTGQTKPPLGLPSPDAKSASQGKPSTLTIEAGSGPRPANAGGKGPSIPGLAGPTTKPQREPLRLPTVVVSGQTTEEVNRTTVREPKIGAPLPQPSARLSLPAIATDGNKPQGATTPNGLPKALTEEVPTQAKAPSTLPLPSILKEKPADLAQARLPLPEPTQGATDARTTQPGPRLATVGEAPQKTSAGTTAKVDAALGPAPARPAGQTTGLPDVPALPASAEKPIPAPFRLSEWISNDALHQEWRRQQFQRSQRVPEARGAEQQRLRLVLDYFLVRDRSIENSTEK